MARRLKVFSTDMGFVRAIVAAPSQKAALEAWGVRDNLFARGAAKEIHDANLANEALAKPGEVLRQPIADALEFVGAANSAQIGKKTSRAPPAAKARSKPSPPPSRKALDRAAANLADEEGKRGAALADLDVEQADLDARRDRLKSASAAAVAAAKRERDLAKAAYDSALKACGEE